MKKRKNIFVWVPLVVAIVIAFLLRFYNLGLRPIWHDEAFTYELVKNFSLVDITTKTAFDVHPPFYYYLAKIWGSIFGYDIFSLRTLSVFMGALLVIGIYLLAKKLINEKVASIAVFLAAMSPFLIQYSQEARMYTLLSLLSLFALYFLFLAFEKNKIRDWVLFVILSSLSLYTQYFAIFSLFALFLYFVVFYKKFEIKKRITFIISLFIIFLSYIPWMPIFYRQFTMLREGFWIPPVNLYSVPNTFKAFLFGSIDMEKSYLVMLSILLILVFAFIIYRYWKKFSQQIVLLFLYLFVPIMVTMVLALRLSLYIDRYFLLSIPAFLVLLGMFFGVFQKKYTYTLLSLIFIIYLVGGYVFYTKHAEFARENGIKSAAEYINQNYQEKDLIVATSPWHNYFVLNYYNNTGEKAKIFDKNGVPRITEAALITEDDIFYGDKEILAGSFNNVWVLSEGKNDKTEELEAKLKKLEEKNFGPMVLIKFNKRPFNDLVWSYKLEY